MGTFCINSATHFGLEAFIIDVEVDISSGLPAFRIVGLPDAAVSEAKDRVKSAIKNSGFAFPRTKVTVNLAPANIKKQGPAFDLPIAVAILAATGVIYSTEQLQSSLLLAELSLKGGLRPTTGALLAAIAAREHGLEKIIVSENNAAETALVQDIDTIALQNLQSLVYHCNEQKRFTRTVPRKIQSKSRAHTIDMADVKGQEHAKRALEIAAAGNHNVLLSGTPGSGKTMLARAVPSVLPSMTFEEALEITKIQSVTNTRNSTTGLADKRPFRSPHHSSSSVALIGGGTWPAPGEVSLAHRGVLFLDEFPEFPRAAIENLRQPLEDGVVTISRAAGTIQFPAQFMLVAAMNPCPCGFLTDPAKPCTCTPSQIMRYQQKISGPLMDRIDMAVDVPRIDFDKLTTSARGESSSVIRKRIQSARDRQKTRYKETTTTTNSELTTKELKEYCKVGEEGRALIKQAVEKLHLSARAYTRVLKVARTIADLEASTSITSGHLAEAFQYRPKARE